MGDPHPFKTKGSRSKIVDKISVMKKDGMVKTVRDKILDSRIRKNNKPFRLDIISIQSLIDMNMV